MKYYKTTPIEAVQFLSFDETHFSERPAWLLEAVNNQTIQFFGTRDKLDIQTLEGMMQAKVGDYLIRGLMVKSMLVIKTSSTKPMPQ